jgi:hypothetical protein
LKEYIKKFFDDNPKLKKVTGVVFVVLGLISALTPFTPVGFLLVLGLELLGLRLLVWDKIKKWFNI